MIASAAHETGRESKQPHGGTRLHDEADRLAAELVIQIEEGALRVFPVDAAEHDVHDDDGHAKVSGAPELEQAVRPREDGGRLQEEEHLALLDVLEQLAQVAEVVRVEEELKGRGCERWASAVCGL